MADVDPLGILNSELKLTQDGVKRRANEQVVRQYMNFGNNHYRRLILLDNVLLSSCTHHSPCGGGVL